MEKKGYLRPYWDFSYYICLSGQSWTSLSFLWDQPFFFLFFNQLLKTGNSYQDADTVPCWFTLRSLPMAISILVVKQRCLCVCVWQVKESQQVKLVFSEQLSKLQTKQNQDTELLEEIRYSSLFWCLDETFPQDESGRHRDQYSDERENVFNYISVAVVCCAVF